MLAGCAGLAGDSGRGTLTPAPVPSPPPTEEPPQTLAPGVREGGTVDTRVLVASHASLLEGTPVTVRYNYTERSANGTLRLRTTTVVGFGTDGRYHYRRTDVGANGVVRRVERWSDGDRVFERTVSDGETTHRVVRDGEGKLVDPDRALPVERAAANSLRQVFDVTEVRVVGREERGNRTYYRLRGEGVRTPNTTHLRNVSLSVIVDERGLVHRYRLGYTTDRGGEPVRVVGRVRFDAVGTTSVDRPEWVSRVD